MKELKNGGTVTIMKTRVSSERLRRGTTSAALGCLSAMCVTTALAQETRPVMEELIITAERREATVQDSALAISAVGGETLRSQNITDLEGLQGSVPGLHLGDNFGLSRVTIRGVSTENVLGGSIGGDAGVNFNLNGVPLARPQSAAGQFYDLARVEVLRGPQGTLYGKNATGGAVNIITNRPTEDFEGRLEVGAGNLNRWRARGSLSGPITDNLQGRVAFLAEEADGFVSNLDSTGDSELGDRSLWGARITIAAELTDNLTFDFFADAFRQDNSAGAYIVQGNVRGGGATTPQEDIGGVFGPSDPDERRVNFDFRGSVDYRDLLTVGGELNWILGDLQFTSVTAFHSMETDNAFDLDGTQVHWVHTQFRKNEAEQFSQEIRLTSIGESSLDWIVGAMYFREDGEGDQRFSFPAFGVNFDSGGEVETRSVAVFGDATWHATDRLSITAGIRWTEDEKKGSEYFDFGGLLARDLPDSSWDATTPRLVIDYQATKDTLVYGSAQRGYKSGGFNIGALQEPYEPETIWNYEIGLKTSTLDDRLTANLAGFYYEYEDQQFTQILGVLAILTNAGASEGRGLEAEVTYFPSDNWRIDIDYAYLDTEFTEFLNLEDPFPELGVQDLSGNVLPRSPEHTFNLGVQYEFALADRFDVSARAEWSYKSRVYFSEFNRDFASQPSVHTGNLFLNFEDRQSGVYGDIYVRNISDETILSNSTITAAVIGFNNVLNMNQPRIYGINLGYRF